MYDEVKMRSGDPRCRGGGVAMLALLSCVMGCASTTMRTAQQLEAGDIVLSGGFDEPGSTFIPRMSGQMLYGVGRGDMSAHLGFSLFTVNGGLGGRYYLTDFWTMALQVDANILIADMLFNEWAEFYTATWNLTTSTNEDRMFYGGFHVSTQLFNDRFFSSRSLTFGGVNAGGVLGLDRAINERVGIQIEAHLAPLFLGNKGNVGLFPIDAFSGDGSSHTDKNFDLNSHFIAQFGFSFYKRIPAVPDLPPSEWVDEESGEEVDREREAPTVSQPPLMTPAAKPPPVTQEETTTTPERAPVPEEPDA